MARVRLADGSSIWIDDLDGGPASKPPKPELAASVDKLRLVLGVGDEDKALPEIG